MVIQVPKYKLLEDTGQTLSLLSLCFLPLKEWNLHSPIPLSPPPRRSASEGRTCLSAANYTTKNTKDRSSVLGQKGRLSPAFDGREVGG